MKKIINKYNEKIALSLSVISIIIGCIGICSQNIDIIYIILSAICGIIGIMTFLLITPQKERIRGFERVETNYRKNYYYRVPTRATTGSMAYDFYADKDYEIKPNEIVKIWTDTKAYMKSNEGLILNVRSSMGGKFMLANSQWWIDSDYYENESNDGNIGIFLKNISNETQYIHKDDKIAQGMFINFLTTDNDKIISKQRKGGFGSTDEGRNVKTSYK